jgi:hypothetical protein
MGDSGLLGIWDIRFTQFFSTFAQDHKMALFLATWEGIEGEREFKCGRKTPT